jgi:hypothetical protein
MVFPFFSMLRPASRGERSSDRWSDSMETSNPIPNRLHILGNFIRISINFQTTIGVEPIFSSLPATGRSYQDR